MRVVVDAMGGDNAPAEIVRGAVQAAAARENIRIILTGRQNIIEKELAKYHYPEKRIAIVPADEVIETAESPVKAIRHKKNSSLVVGMKMVHDKDADAFVSAGSSGAILAGGQLLVGRIKGIQRTPLAPLIPTEKGVALLIDCGANMDPRPAHLLQFAQMGSVYMEHVVGIKNPRVALLNVGAEEEKGNKLVKSTYPLLEKCSTINFTGNIEARDIPYGKADVIVTEAFAGNVVLKLYEGVASVLLSEVKSGIMSTTRSKIGGALIKPALKKTLRAFDVSRYGGAPLLGLTGLVVKTHGSAHASDVRNSIFQCVTFKKERINEKIEEFLQQQTKEKDTKEKQ